MHGTGYSGSVSVIQMRNLLKSLGLLLLLITAQQGAVVHELSHYSGATQSSGTKAGGTKASGTKADVLIGARGSADANCALCPAFAQVLTPAFTHSFEVPLLVRADLQRSREPQYPSIETAALAPRSRGPPSLS
jgi:hypothetical protein